MTAQIWQGGAFINFTIPFIFQAETSAETEVMRPIRDLMKLTMPKDETPGGGGILSAPGPHIDIKKLVSNLSAVGIEGVSDLFQGVTGLAMNASNMIDTFKKLAGRTKQRLAKAKFCSSVFGGQQHNLTAWTVPVLPFCSYHRRCAYFQHRAQPRRQAH
jgi:hypothetical protein